MYPRIQCGKNTGSGIILDKHGHVATCEHIVEGNDKGLVTLGNDRSLTFNFTVVAKGDKTRDVAILRTRLNVSSVLRHLKIQLPTFQLSRRKIQNGEIVGLCGYPNVTAPDAMPTMCLGIVAIVRYPAGPIMVGAPTYPGNSGGPCFTMDGTVIGLVSSGYDTATLRIPGGNEVSFPSPYSEIFPMSTVAFVARKNNVKLGWKPKKQKSTNK